MKHHQVIIVGGGPAGAACARQLVRGGADVLVLDKQPFPRPKLCAGWVTPQLLAALDLHPEDYPHTLSEYPALQIHLRGVPLRLPGRQYAVRREEFDDWLLRASGAPLEAHHVRNIQREKGRFLIDERYTAEYLIGAGGTHCPVYQQLFKATDPRTGARIAALEVEYKTDWQEGRPQLWFFHRGLPGYAWYLPKQDGYLNIGLGGNAAVLKERGQTILDHWKLFIGKLTRSGLIDGQLPEPDGHVYFLRGRGQQYSGEKAYLVGDAAGLATLDMGEGIHPAVVSGFLAAAAILREESYSLENIPRISLLPGCLGWLLQD